MRYIRRSSDLYTQSKGYDPEIILLQLLAERLLSEACKVNAR